MSIVKFVFTCVLAILCFFSFLIAYFYPLHIFLLGNFFFFFLIGLKKTLHALRPWGFSLQQVFFKFVICLLIFVFLMHKYVYASVWSNIPMLSLMFYFLLLCLEKLPLLWCQINISLYFFCNSCWFVYNKCNSFWHMVWGRSLLFSKY